MRREIQTSFTPFKNWPCVSYYSREKGRENAEMLHSSLLWIDIYRCCTFARYSFDEDYHHHHHVGLTARSSWLFLAIYPYHRPPLACIRGGIFYLLRVCVRKYLLFGQHWLVLVQETIRERHLWVRPCFSSNLIFKFSVKGSKFR